jgi:hypothetical protein
MGLPEPNHPSKESKDVLMVFQEVPIEPGGLIVLIVGIVVSPLSIHELITRTKHGCSIGQHEKTEKILDLPPAQAEDLWGNPFVSLKPAVPAPIVIEPVLVIVTVDLVMFFVIADQIEETEAIVGGNEVDTLKRMVDIPRPIRKKIVAPIESLHEGSHPTPITLHKASNIVSELPVPLKPGYARKASTQKIFLNIPSLSDDLEIGLLGQTTDIMHKGRILQVH